MVISHVFYQIVAWIAITFNHLTVEHVVNEIKNLHALDLTTLFDCKSRMASIGD